MFSSDPLLASMSTDSMSKKASISDFPFNDFFSGQDFILPWKEEEEDVKKECQDFWHLKQVTDLAAEEQENDVQELLIFRPLSPTISSSTTTSAECNLLMSGEEEINVEVTSHDHLAALSLPTSSSKKKLSIQQQMLGLDRSANQEQSLELSIYGAEVEKKKIRQKIKTSDFDEKVDIQNKVINNNSLFSNSQEPVCFSDVKMSVSHCSVCKLVFANSMELKKHKDEYTKSLSCCQCQKKFVSSSKLVSHQRKHSKEKPFQCKSCGKYYTHRTTLIRHQQHYCQTLRAKCEDSNSFPMDLLEQDEAEVVPSLEVNNIGLKSLNTTCSSDSTVCRICNRGFTSVNCLNEHSKAFLDSRTCCLCGKVMGNKSKLLTHHRSHTKESPYACSFCGKSFSENSTLRKHEATHGARNFQCDLCDKGFVRKDYLAKHMLTHRQTYKCSQCDFICHERTDIESHVTTVHSMMA